MKNFEHWGVLSRLQDVGSLAHIDLAFAESVLKKLGSSEESHGAILATLFALARQGHLALNISALPEAMKLLGIEKEDPLAALLSQGAETFPRRGISVDPTGHPSTWLCQRGDHLYLQKHWVQESEILFHLRRLMQSPPSLILSSWESDSKMNEAQKQAVRMGMEHPLSLLTGGPGTGKTYAAACIAKACLDSLPLEQKKQFRMILSAPTGKAASKLEGSLRRELGTQIPIRTGTLHSLLGIKSYGHEEKTQPLFADLIIVDECSMIDSHIFSRLLASVQGGARCILIGDPDQLPPVEAGSIFADLVDSGVFPTTRLTECLRSESEEILSFAKSIREGSAEKALSLLQNREWIDLDEERKTVSQLYDHLWKRCKDKFPSPSLEKPLAPMDRLGAFIILSCMRKGPLGVDAVNHFFLNQSISSASEGAFCAFPILMTQSDAELQLFNGDHGWIVRQMTRELSLKQFQMGDEALFDDRKGGIRKIPALALGSFEYNYCQSVHKSQGSEYDEILLLVPRGSEAFGREVLYTAVTRARNQVLLAGSRATLLASIESSSRKVSGLIKRLQKQMVEM